MKRYRKVCIAVAILTVVLAASVTPALAAPATDDDTVVGSPATSSFRRENCCFRVSIGGDDYGIFSTVEGISVEQEVIEYQNGDDPLLRKRPGRVSYGEITLTRQFEPGSTLNDWIESARLDNGEFLRQQVTVVLEASNGDELRRWNYFECFPKSWRLYSPENSNNEVLLEEMVIVVEYFEES